MCQTHIDIILDPQKSSEEINISNLHVWQCKTTEVVKISGKMTTLRILLIYTGWPELQVFLLVPLHWMWRISHIFASKVIPASYGNSPALERCWGLGTTYQMEKELWLDCSILFSSSRQFQFITALFSG